MLEAGQHLAAHGFDGRHDRILLVAQGGLDGPPIRLGELLAGHTAADDGDRVAGHLQNDRMRALSERRAWNRSARDAGQMRARDGLRVGAGRDQRCRQEGERGAGKKTRRLGRSGASSHGSIPLIYSCGRPVQHCPGLESRISPTSGERVSLAEKLGQPFSRSGDYVTSLSLPQIPGKCDDPVIDH
jgi:hypothetical protein